MSAMEVDEQDAARPSAVVSIPLHSGEELEIDLADFDDTEASMEELKGVFSQEKTGPDVWTRTAAEYWRRYTPETALKMAQWGLDAVREQHSPALEVPLLCLMANYNLVLARNAPTLILKNAKADKLDPNLPTKGFYYQKATEFVQRAASIEAENPLVLNVRAALYLATGKLDEAMKTFDRTIAQHPSHTIAQMGKARILCARRQHRAALKVYQNVLAIAPDSLPDPRIGIGICYYNLGDRELAQKAWERSLKVNPGKESLAAALLLGLLHLNTSRDPATPVAAKEDAYSKGLGQLQQVWGVDKTVASAASGLAGHFLSTQKWDTAIKLGERAIQYADSRAALSEGQLVMARALHAQGKLAEAAPYYSRCCEKSQEQLVGTIASAQIHVTNGPGDYPTAINAFENILRNQQNNIETLVNLAAVHTRQVFSAHIGAGDQEGERKRAMELYEQVMRIVAPRLLDSKAQFVNGHGEVPSNASDRVREVGSNADLFIEIARLWADTEPVRALQALRESARLRGEGKVSPALYSNIGCLEYTLGNHEEAAACFQEGLNAASGFAFATQELAEATTFTLFYNLAIAYEAIDKAEEAIQIYEQRLLQRHPEFVEAKARLALIYLRRKDTDRAHELLKQSLTAQPSSGEIRSLYTYFLLETKQEEHARTFLRETLTANKKDVYAICATGVLSYQKARENKGSGPEAHKARAERYLRAAESFYTCLQYDPQCAIAAQGIAIALAEGSLGSGKDVVAGTPAASESEKRLRNTRDALTILTKIREALRDGNVYVNIGHCHFAREEWDKAIEAYETASKRYFGSKNVSILLLAARSWFFKAIQDGRYAFMSNALAFARQANELSPQDDSIRFNIAIIQHRGLQLLNELDDEKNEAKLAKRTTAELEQSIQEVEEAQLSFASLAENRAKNLAYSADLASQRVAFGRTLLAKARDSIPRQQDFEQREEAKAALARQTRQEAKDKQAKEEAERLDLIRQNAQKLAEDRKKAQEEAATWFNSYRDPDSGGEDGKKKRGGGKKKKAAKKEGSATPPGSDEEAEKPKRKRAPPKKKKAPAVKDDEEPEPNEDGGGPVENGEEEEDEAAARPVKKSRKAYKSAEIIDSEDDE